MISFLIASPVAWLIISKWLHNFAYRIDITWWVFAIAGLLSVIIALATDQFPGNKSSNGKPGKIVAY